MSKSPLYIPLKNVTLEGGMPGPHLGQFFITNACVPHTANRNMTKIIKVQKTANRNCV